ncbi:uncharacterized protein LOC132380616 isoform X2 [Hypanus sabinus]|uniref:uncharacterized protein LOC132380616 isoform X2 n=1 Tax=Hypanus sabinus TaxID=79690 RepID=UPI0028C3A16A|nr:uncharacterized protein LOC132380616 isoform X2 [Hypanus sabinus]
MGSTPPFRDVLPTPTLLRLLKQLDGTLAPEKCSPQKEAPFLYLGLPTMLDEELPHIQSSRAALAHEEPTTSSTSVSQQIGQLRKVTKTTGSNVTFAPGSPMTHGPPPEAERLPAPSFSCLKKVGASASQVSFRPSSSGLPHPPGPRPAFPRLTKPWGQNRGSSPGFLVRPCLAASGDEDAGDDGVSDMVVGSLDDRFRGPPMHTQDIGSSDIMEYTQDGGLNDLMGDIEDGGPSVLLADAQDGGSSDLMGDIQDGGSSDLMGNTEDGGSSILLADSQDGGSSDLMGDTEDGGSSVLLADSQDGGSSDLMGDTPDGGSSDFMGDTQDGSSSDLMGDTQDGGSSDFMGECQDRCYCVGLADSQDGGSMAVNQDGEGSHLLANSQDSSSDPMLSSQEGESADPLEDAQDEGCRKGGQSGVLVLAGPAELGGPPASPEHELPLVMEEPEAGPSQVMGPVAQPNMQDVYTELQRDMFYKAFLFHKFMRLGSPQQKPGHQQAEEHP